MSFAEKLAVEVASRRLGPPCKTCTTLASLDASDLVAYHEARQSDVPVSVIARALDLLPGTYRKHLTDGHVEPR